MGNESDLIRETLEEIIKPFCTIYNRITDKLPKGVQKEILEKIFLSSLQIQKKENSIQFEDFYLKLSLGGQSQFDPSHDYAVFVFCLLFYLSEDFKKLVSEIPDERRMIYLGIIYDIIKEFSPNSLSSTKDQYTIYTNNLFNVLTLGWSKEWMDLLSRTISKVVDHRQNLIESFIGPWNFMYYDSQPSIKTYINRLKENKIYFEENSMLKSYRVHPTFEFNNSDQHLIKCNPYVEVWTRNEKVSHQWIKGEFLDKIYEALKFYPGYKYSITEAGTNGIYNLSKKIWITISEPVYDSHELTYTRLLIISFR